MRINSIEDIGHPISVEDLDNKMKIFSILKSINFNCSIIAAFVFCCFVVLEGSNALKPLLYDSIILSIILWIVSICSFIVAKILAWRWEFAAEDFEPIKKSDCRIVLDAIEKYEELNFLKERIGGMDRKLTPLEGEYIKQYVAHLETVLDERAYKLLCGVQS